MHWYGTVVKSTSFGRAGDIGIRNIRMLVLSAIKLHKNRLPLYWCVVSKIKFITWINLVDDFTYFP